jgi:small-conductance mechanosensitive channel
MPQTVGGWRRNRKLLLSTSAYLMLVKTIPTKQDAVSRELRQRIKECFEKNQVQTAAPGRVYVLDSAGQESRSTLP